MEDNQGIDPYSSKQYSNFVKSSLQREPKNNFSPSTKISGLEATRMYLEEVAHLTTAVASHHNEEESGSDNCNKTTTIKVQSNICTRELITAVQNNDSTKVRIALLSCPDRVNTIDDFGWSLLMIACQANSVETVKELLKQGADLTIRDKAGNSARSLVINNKNAALASIILSHRDFNQRKDKYTQCSNRIIETSEYICDICGGQKFPDKISHIASTLHNLNVSKKRKIPSCYKIPESNKGFQIMLKSGWNKDIGLGASGSGMKYPIKCVPKKDRKGLGNEKSIKKETKTVNVLEKQRNFCFRNRDRERAMEVHFRREFY